MTQNKAVQPHKPAEKSPKTHNKVVIFLGPPGAGKGTQAERLASDQQLVKISTGDILRDHVSRGTELGQQVAPILESGKLVPDELLIALIRDQLSKMETVRVIFDGFPRTTAQAQELDMLLEELGAPISAVPLLDVPDEVVIARIVERGKTSGRNDDNEQVARHRQEVYREQTQPLIDYYAARGHLKTINGVGSMDEVYRRLLGTLD